jgi:hypothetical protein
LDPQKVLIAEETVGNEVGYKLKATCSWSHIDLTAPDRQPFWGGTGRIPVPGAAPSNR